MLKRISMAGSDVSVTDERIANGVLEYAKHLARAQTTDTVTVPVATAGHADEFSLLLGPASQITVSTNEDASLEAVELPDVEATVADLQQRVRELTGPDVHHAGDEHAGTASETFVNFDEFGRK